MRVAALPAYQSWLAQMIKWLTEKSNALQGEKEWLS
jgi:hypothetical protein